MKRNARWILVVEEVEENEKTKLPINCHNFAIIPSIIVVKTRGNE